MITSHETSAQLVPQNTQRQLKEPGAVVLSPLEDARLAPWAEEHHLHQLGYQMDAGPAGFNPICSCYNVYFGHDVTYSGSIDLQGHCGHSTKRTPPGKTSRAGQEEHRKIKTMQAKTRVRPEGHVMLSWPPSPKAVFFWACLLSGPCIGPFILTPQLPDQGIQLPWSFYHAMCSTKGCQAH